MTTTACTTAVAASAATTTGGVATANTCADDTDGLSTASSAPATMSASVESSGTRRFDKLNDRATAATACTTAVAASATATADGATTVNICVTDDDSLVRVFAQAFKNPTYRNVIIGFSTCGFNMSIIEAHLFSQFVSWGIAETRSSFIMTIYGILTMLGAVATGYLSTRFKMKTVLGTTYFVRVLISLAMLALPCKGLVFAVAATALLGMTGDSTVPPTMGLITREFGAPRIAVFYGIALAFHQIGAFTSAAFGGFCYERFGTYTLLWAANGVLCLLAACACWSIRERREEKI